MIKLGIKPEGERYLVCIFTVKFNGKAISQTPAYYQMEGNFAVTKNGNKNIKDIFPETE